MATVSDIYRVIDQMAPFALQMSFDNAGFLVGHQMQAVTKVLVSLDITEEVVREAASIGAQLIISHHPVLFHPAKQITDETPTGRILLALAEAHIAAICAHTNLDAVENGVNDCLARTLELQHLEQLHQDGVDEQGRPYGIGRIGAVAPCSLHDFVEYVKEKIYTDCVRLVDSGKTVHRVAVGGGSCGSMLDDALAAGCDTFVTSDVKYDTFLEAKAQGINLIDAGHFSTENVVCPALVNRLSKAFPEVTVQLSTCHKEVFSYQ